MNRSCMLLGALIAASTVSLPWAQAQISSQEQITAEKELEKTIPKMQITEDWLQLDVPGYTMGEVPGVSQNSKGHIFVYSRTNPQGIARGGTAAMLWEFDQNGKFIKEWGAHNYAASFAHSVRVDRHDNVWQVDEGSGMIIKYNPQGEPVEQFGRTPEAIDYLEANVEKAGRGYSDAGAGKAKDPLLNIHPIGGTGTFNRPTDIAWDSHDNIYVTDGYGNSRVVKIAPGGHWLKKVGTWGTGQDQFNIPHSIAIDNQDHVYVADRNNSRIQVYDTDLNYQKTYTGMGSPWGICVTPPDASGKQYLFSGDGTTGHLYKMDLDGKVLGWAQTSLGHGEDDAGRLIHEISCAAPNVIYKGSAILWSVEKITIH